MFWVGWHKLRERKIRHPTTQGARLRSRGEGLRELLEHLPTIHPPRAGHFLRCDTKDFVEIGTKQEKRVLFFYFFNSFFITGIQAAVFYRISDPEKAVLTVGDASAIEKLVKETSTATLQVLSPPSLSPVPSPSLSLSSSP